MTDGARAPGGRPATGPGAPPSVTVVLVAVVTGLALAAAHPGPALWWLVFAVVPGWLTVAHLARRSSARVVFGLGVLLGLAAFVPMLRWVALPAGVAAWLLLALTQSVWVGLATVVVRPWTRRRAVALVGPLVWTGTEVLRARVPLGGFGWGDLATAHTDSSWMLTSARVLGADGLTMLTALLGACAWASVVAFRTTWRRGPEQEDQRVVSPGAARVVRAFDEARPLLLATVGVAALGTLVTVGTPERTGTLDVLVVQGNDGSGDLVGAAEDARIAEAHADATVEAVAAGGRPDLTVWAENALDGDPTTEPSLGDPLRRAAAATDGGLLVGLLRDGPRPGTFRNSMATVDADGAVGTVYDKQVVVPFGEYVPWRSVLGRIPALRQVPRDAVPGEGPVTHEVAGVRVATVICFETLFAPTVRAAVADDDAGLVVAATNDASFGRGAESAQHVAQSRLRAVETGRTVVHAAISGTSAIVDADGVVRELAPLFEVATIRAEVPVVTGATPAAVVARPLSGTIALAAVLLGLVAVPAVRRRVPLLRPDDEQEPT